jgi:ribulose-5-phosphate 4-epimerase/fuculose-1-phosphate aldolase
MSTLVCNGFVTKGEARRVRSAFVSLTESRSPERHLEPNVGLAADPTVARSRAELALALRAAAFHGFNEGIDNHFSMAVPGRDDLFLLNRFGPHWSEVTPDDILVIDFHGNVVLGDGEWEVSAFMIHRGCHRSHPDAHVVFHTHMPWATAVACTGTGFISDLSQNSLYFHGRHARLPFGGLADGEAEGDRIGAAIAHGVTAAFLDNHGVIVVGRDAADAWHKLYFLERACEVQVRAQSTGQPLVRVDAAVAQRTARQWLGEHDKTPLLFSAVQRQLGLDWVL